MERGKSLITREEVENENWDTITMVMVTMVMVFMVLLPVIEQTSVMAQEAATAAAFPRVPTYVEPLEAVAGNVGAMWIQMTPENLPNELRMITENSTGSFEDVLISLST